ncbi:uncharacterized protein TRUGW13939_00259 [Talaromyces rugulosus]|uniref:NmrA-like domain-containing protein n=1 Tax=Talaromyces rugulosus TaxID=121627 RepID=A0A7H8QJ14_TALRU|nr:uncharacterized protein TRUGW13939_00259 [Talaromyces rugulosus]QKX53183.1 hypothetical protein TRUGW13939_00259 [Talaromyces rugulosus]
MGQQYASDQPSGYNNHVEKIALVGAGGRIRKHITQALLNTGKHTIIAITRQDSDNTLPGGVTVIKVDYNNQESLVEALKGQHVLIITMNVMAPPDTQTRLIYAAATAGVPWVLLNEFGGDPYDVEKGKDGIVGAMKVPFRDQIERLGKSSYIGLVCSFWYEFSFGGGSNRYGFDFEDRSLVIMDDGKTKINTSTMPQVGRAVASLLRLKTLPDDKDDKSPSLVDFKDKAVYISSFTVSQQDMLESVLRVTGTKLEDWKITHTTAKDYWKSGQEVFKTGDAAGFVRLLYARAFFPDDPENYERTRGLHNELLGLPQENLDEFTKIGMETRLTLAA